MYNPKSLDKFFERVHKEASEAAQSVYDKYTEELKQRVKNQMYSGHELISGMGTCFVKHSNEVGEEFCMVLANHTQYHDKVDAGFLLPSKIKKDEKNIKSTK